jgi:hypothetical protein
MSLSDFLQRSGATAAFQDAVRAFQRTGVPNDRVAFDVYAPPVKVERALTKMLEEYPELPIEWVEISGSSGCEFFRGKLMIHAGEASRGVHFHWDCKWKAVQQGWTDYFGFPDQARAAREFGYDCFRDWVEEHVPEAAGA